MKNAKHNIIHEFDNLTDTIANYATRMNDVFPLNSTAREKSIQQVKKSSNALDNVCYLQNILRA